MCLVNNKYSETNMETSNRNLIKSSEIIEEQFNLIASLNVYLEKLENRISESNSLKYVIIEKNILFDYLLPKYILFNAFLNDMLYSLKEKTLENVTNEKDIQKFIKTVYLKFEYDKLIVSLTSSNKLLSSNRNLVFNNISKSYNPPFNRCLNKNNRQNREGNFG